MKILMISNHLGVQSGVQRYIQNLLLHLDTAKYRVTLFVGQCPPDQASTAPALEAHGVEIQAESKVGEGTSIRFWLETESIETEENEDEQ